MKRNTFMWALCAVGVTVLVASGAVIAAVNRPADRNEPAAEEISENTVLPKDDAYEYTLREYNGKVAVFKSNSESPEAIFDIYINSLPDYDKGQLAQGIRAKTFEELFAMIEDYTS